MVRSESGLVVILASACLAQTIQPLTEAGEGFGSAALSPDGKTLAFERSLKIFLRALESGADTHFAGDDDDEGFLDAVKWSPDGQRIAFTREYCHYCAHKLFLKNATGGAEFPLGEVCGGSPSWTPDGRYLIATESTGGYEGDECQLVLIPADGSKRTVLRADDGNMAAISPDGKQLLYSTGNVLKLAQLTSDFRLAGPPVAVASEAHAISSINWAADGHAAVYESRGYAKMLPMGGPIYSSKLLDMGGEIGISQILADGTALGVETIWPTALWRLDLGEAGKSAEKVREVAWTDSDLSVSPDGKMVAFVTGRNGPEQIWVSNLDGSEPRALVASIPPYYEYGDNTRVGSVSWSPDGQWIAFLTNPGVGYGVTDARLFLIPSAGGPLRALVELCTDDFRPIPWAADSKSVFIAQEKLESVDLKTDYFQVDILSGKQTPVSEQSVPPNPRRLAPEGADDAHLAQEGRFLYFVTRGESKSRIVMVRDLVSAQ